MPLKRELPVLSKHHKELAAQLNDLIYWASEDIFSYLEREECMDTDDEEVRLQVFFEIVTFFLFWTDKACRKRIFGGKKAIWKTVFSDILHHWEAFFVDYPQGPSLDTIYTETVMKRFRKKLEGYHHGYTETLEAQGVHHALKACCGQLLDAIAVKTLPTQGNEANGIKDRVIHHLGSSIRSVMQRTDVILLGQPL